MMIALSFKPNRSLSEKDFEVLKTDTTTFLTMLENRVCLMIANSQYTSVVSSKAHYVVEQWLRDNAVGLFHVKTEQDSGARRRIDVYFMNPADAVNIKVRMDGTNLSDWD